MYWRNYSGVQSSDLPDDDQAYVADNDSRGLFESMLIWLPARWVNGWDAIQLHQTKPVQLAMVARLGIPIPRSIVTNAPSAAGAVRRATPAHRSSSRCRAARTRAA